VAVGAGVGAGVAEGAADGDGDGNGDGEGEGEGEGLGGTGVAVGEGDGATEATATTFGSRDAIGSERPPRTSRNPTEVAAARTSASAETATGVDGLRRTPAEAGRTTPNAPRR
jgi:hypothetical protein